MEVSKRVFFIGAWKTQNVTDKLLHDISMQMKTKKGYETVVRLSPEGLVLNILNEKGEVTRKDRVPLQNIADLAENRYSTTCVLVIVRDQENMYKVLVFICTSEKDAGDLVQGYAVLKKKLSGEGYNFDLKPKGTNWTLVSKSEPEVRETGYTVVQNNSVVNGHPVIVNGDSGGTRVYTSSREGSSVQGHVVQNSNLQTELHQLADEVREIKTTLQRPQPGATFVNAQGYRFTAAPVPLAQSRVQTVTSTQRGQPVRYIRQDGGTQSIAYRGGGQRRLLSSTTQKHYLSSTNSLPGSMRLAYQTKQPRSALMVTQNSPVVIEQKRNLRRTGSSDTVQKNIEDVYRHRSSKKLVYYPQHERTVEYVNNVEAVPPPVAIQQTATKIIATPSPATTEVKTFRYETQAPAPIKTTIYENSVVRQQPQHEVKYVSEERAFINEPIVTSVSNTNVQNVSTIVNTSVNDDLDYSQVSSRDAGFDYGQQHGLLREETGQAIIYRAPRHGHRYIKKSDTEVVKRKTSTEETGGNVIYVSGDSSNVHSYNDDYQGVQMQEHVHEAKSANSNVIYVSGDSSNVHSYNDDYQSVQMQEHVHETKSANSNVIYVSGNNTNVHSYNDGHQGEQMQEQVHESETTISGGGGVYHVKVEGAEDYRQQAHDFSEGQLERESVTVVQSQQPAGLFGAYTRYSEPYDPNVDIPAADAYSYHKDDEVPVQTSTLADDDEVRIEDFVDHGDGSYQTPADIVDEALNDDLSGEAVVNEEDVDTSGVKHVQYADEIEETINDKAGEVEEGVGGYLSSSQKSRDSNNNPDADVEDMSTQFQDLANEKKDEVIDDIDEFKANNRKMITDEIKERIVNTSEQNVLF